MNHEIHQIHEMSGEMEEIFVYFVYFVVKMLQAEVAAGGGGEVVLALRADDSGRLWGSLNHEIHQIHEMSGEKRVMFSCASCISWLTKMLQGVFTTAAEYEIIRTGR